MGANDKAAATYHPLHPCTRCDATYPSYLAALDCAEQDDSNAEDRKHSRLYR